MKVILLKDHELGKLGATIEVSEPRANYLIGCKVAEVAKEKKVKAK